MDCGSFDCNKRLLSFIKFKKILFKYKKTRWELIKNRILIIKIEWKYSIQKIVFLEKLKCGKWRNPGRIFWTFDYLRFDTLQNSVAFRYSSLNFCGNRNPP